MTDLKTLHDQAVALERELGITDTPRLSTPILRERIATGEKLNLQGRNGSNPPQWFPNPVGPGWTFLRIAEKPEAQRLVEEAFARGEKVKFQSRANPSENWSFLINGDFVRPLWDWNLFEYRIAAPEPRFVPWTAEDAKEFRGLWVRPKNDRQSEFQILSFTSDGYVGLVGSSYKMDQLFDLFEQLDGTKCGKLEEAK